MSMKSNSKVLLTKPAQKEVDSSGERSSAFKRASTIRPVRRVKRGGLQLRKGKNLATNKKAVGNVTKSALDRFEISGEEQRQNPTI
jgi:hypothetical protein